MKKSTLCTKLMPVVFLLGTGCILQNAMADEGCNKATLSGSYSYTQSGLLIQGAQQIPTALAGSENFDGNGHINGKFTSVTGQSIQRNVPYTGNYTVKSDCTGTYTLTTTDGSNVTINLDLFIAPSGDSFNYIETDIGAISTGVETRVARRVNP